MSHDLNFNEKNQEYSFVFNAKKGNPWHNLGQNVEGSMTVEEAIQKAHLDYNVVEGEIEVNTYQATEDPFPPAIKCYTHKATVREDTNALLGIVGKDYKIVQNIECFDFFNELLGRQVASIETAGALGVGERIFMTALIPEELMIGKDAIQQYFLLSSSHDGSGSIDACKTMQKVVCANTLTVALNNCTNRIRIKHTANAKDKIKEAARLMEYSIKYAEEFKKVMEYLRHVSISDVDVQKLIYELTCTKEEKEFLTIHDLRTAVSDEVISVKKANIIGDIHKSVYNGIGQNDEPGNAYWLVNGISNYVSNNRSYNSHNDRLASAEKRYDSLTSSSGYGTKLLQETFNKMLLKNSN